MILLSLKISKIQNIHFVGNFIVSIRRKLYYDDVIVMSLKVAAWLMKASRKEQ